MDIINFLKDNKVQYWTSGKNISSGYIGIRCLFCDDRSNHLGIRLSDLRATCWKCGSHTIASIIQKITKHSYYDSKAIADSLDRHKALEQKVITAEKLIFPPYFASEPAVVHRKYLESRGFNTRQLTEDYKLRYCYQLSKYCYRIIIPIFLGGKLVSFTSRDITGTARAKYIAASAKEAIIDPANLIFNLDSVEKNKDAFLVEGPFDVFKIGDSTFCFLGIKANDFRIRQIALANIRKLNIFFDNDEAGKNAAKYIASTLAPLVQEVNIIRFTSKNSSLDPARATPLEISQLKTYLKFNID